MSRQSTPQEDADIAGVEAALRRAARRARELGERTGTPVYVLRDGKIVDLTRENGQQQANHKQQR
jgi:hypothetical protein